MELAQQHMDLRRVTLKEMRRSSMADFSLALPCGKVYPSGLEFLISGYGIELESQIIFQL